MNPNITPSSASALDREGHLTALSIDRYLYDAPELDPEFHSSVEAHVGTCDLCRSRVDEVRDFDGSAYVADALSSNLLPFPASPEPHDASAGAFHPSALDSTPLEEPARQAKVVSLASRRRALTLTVGVLAAAAATALVFFMAQPQDGAESGRVELDPAADRITLKGKPIAFEVHVHDGTSSRLVTSGDTIAANERVGFRVQSREAGHLLIVGVDDLGHAYLCYPQDEDKGGQAVALAPSDVPMQLPQAMRFDAVAGHERLVAVFCDAPFTFGDISADLAGKGASAAADSRLPNLRAGCVQSEVILEKTSEQPR